jgi:hypothetical protein
VQAVGLATEHVVGFDGYLSKPVNVGDSLAMVKRFCERLAR